MSQYQFPLPERMFVPDKCAFAANSTRQTIRRFCRAILAAVAATSVVLIGSQGALAQLGVPRDGESTTVAGDSDTESEKIVSQAGGTTRSFVKAWKVSDLQRDLNRISSGRSFANGKQMFTVASCIGCHRLNKAGGTVGPDLDGAAKRNSRAAILREIIEPSKLFPSQYRTHMIVTHSGKVYQGLIVRQDATHLFLADNVSLPDKLRKIMLSDIDEQKLSPLSLMPTDLLNTLTKLEILDLLAYIEAGGRPEHSVFKPNDE